MKNQRYMNYVEQVSAKLPSASLLSFKKRHASPSQGQTEERLKKKEEATHSQKSKKREERKPGVRREKWR
jgi:hypothetical protein